MGTVTAGIYARISSDEDGRGLGVARQVEDCAAEVNRRGWGLAETYVDNDVSATRSKVRPEYQRMLGDIRAGRIKGLVVWDVDRLTRTPRELEDIIDLADRHGLSLASVGGEIDLATPQGRMTARIKGSVARHEAEQMSRRIKRKFDERAAAGAPHGLAAYGYRRVVDHDDRGRRIGAHDELDLDQASVIRKIAKDLLSGVSERSVVTYLNTTGVPAPRGGAWTATQLRQLMLRDRNAGLRRHRGQVIGTAGWPAIYTRETHDRVVALLTDPGRKSNKGSARRHLLTGIARCGRDGCDGTVVVNVGRIDSKGKRQPPAYVCSVCHRVRRRESAVDGVVEAVMVERLSRPDALSQLASGDPQEAQRAREDAAALDARLQLAADQYADGAITGDQLRRITERLRPRIEHARRAVARAEPRDGLAALTGADAAKRWAGAPLDVKRAAIDLLMSVTIMPSGPGKRFDPTTVAIQWRDAGALDIVESEAGQHFPRC